MVFEKRRRHFERYIEIGRVLTKHGWNYLLSLTGLADVFQLRRQHTGIPPQPVQVREALEELGTTFIKLGQALSTRPDIVPIEYLTELEKLQDQAPAVPRNEIRKTIEEEFGTPLDTTFSTFDLAPLASASIGQTHIATLPNGNKVVVKIQRPGIRQSIETDLEIVAGIARFLEQHIEKVRYFKLCELVDEFSITIHQELDYTRDGRNGDNLRENLAECDYVKVARTIWEYTTPRVLTSEFLPGIKITDIEALDAHGYNRRKIASNLTRAYLRMIFVDGFFHGDPHPGNLVVLENNVVGIFDYGIVGRLHHDMRTQITMLFSNYVQEDSSGFAKALLLMGTWPASLDRNAFEQEIDRLLRKYYGAPIRELNIGEVLSHSLRIGAKHRVSLPSSLALLVKVIIGVEGIDHILYPDYDLTSEARPFLMRSVRDEFSVTQLKEDFLEGMLAWKLFIMELPTHFLDVLEHMSEGTFRINFRHEGLEGPVRDLDRSANRMSFALVASSIIIASALILSSRVGPVWRGYPLLGVIGFAIAFIFGVWLMISIIRAGKLW